MIKIRPAVPADLDVLLALLKILFSLEEDFSFDEVLQRRGLELMLGNERAQILAAEVSGEVIGMCSGQLTVSTAEGGPALLVEDVVVQEKYRGQGIGTRLVQEITAWGKVQGVSRLQLLADKNNSSALVFYQKLGWQTSQLICLRRTLTSSGRKQQPHTI